MSERKNLWKINNSIDGYSDTQCVPMYSLNGSSNRIYTRGMTLDSAVTDSSNYPNGRAVPAKYLDVNITYTLTIYFPAENGAPVYYIITTSNTDRNLTVDCYSYLGDGAEIIDFSKTSPFIYYDESSLARESNTLPLGTRLYVLWSYAIDGGNLSQFNVGPGVAPHDEFLLELGSFEFRYGDILVESGSASAKHHP